MLTAATRVVEIPASGALTDLLGGRTRAEVFTAAEARRCAERPDLTGWAGRFAAKLAVADLLGLFPEDPAGLELAGLELAGLELTGLEIVPDYGLCPDAGCVQPHPPAVRLAPELAEALVPGARLRVSISHSRRLAIAIAVVTRPALSPRTSDRSVDPIAQ